MAKRNARNSVQGWAQRAGHGSGPTATHELTIGDRFRMSALGAARYARLADKIGIIVGRSVYANSFSVRFDGNKSTSTIHRSFIEPIHAPETQAESPDK